MVNSFSSSSWVENVIELLSFVGSFPTFRDEIILAIHQCSTVFLHTELIFIGNVISDVSRSSRFSIQPIDLQSQFHSIQKTNFKLPKNSTKCIIPNLFFFHLGEPFKMHFSSASTPRFSQLHTPRRSVPKNMFCLLPFAAEADRGWLWPYRSPRRSQTRKIT